MRRVAEGRLERGLYHMELKALGTHRLAQAEGETAESSATAPVAMIFRDS